MSQEKELLLKKEDLCARLPYGVKVRGVFLNYNKDKDKILYEECDRELDYRDLNRYESLKPYLRPISSMTEEELKEFAYTILQQPDLDAVRNWQTLSIDLEELSKVSDWLNKKMFDYRDLIPKGLALEAPEGMYNTKIK